MYSRRYGNEIFIQPRLLKLLSALVGNADRVVSKVELLKLVWDDVIVGEESLSKATFDLRKFLNENFSNPPIITTIRKVGYKLELSPTGKKRSAKYRSLNVSKIVVYTAVIAILLILVLRGLRY